MSSSRIRILFASACVLNSVAAQADGPTLQRSVNSAGIYSLTAREAQYQALSAMPAIEIEYGPHGRVRRIEGHTGIFAVSSKALRRGEGAGAVFGSLRAALLASGTESLVVRRSGVAPIGGHYVMTDQFIDGIPVLDARVNFVVDANGEITMVNSLFVPQAGVSKTPKLSSQAARTRLTQLFADPRVAEKATIQPATGSSLAFWTNWGEEGRPRLLWLFEVQFTKDGERKHVRFGVDANTGEVPYSEQLSFGLNRTVYTHNYRSDTNLPTSSGLIGTEGNPPVGNSPALTIYQNVVNPINAWSGTSFGYDVVNLIANWGVPGDYGSATRVVGGSKYLFFNDQRTDIDSVAHEYGHGLYIPHVTNAPASIYFIYDEWFAGNEFWGDLSAVMTDAYLNGVSSSMWNITNVRSWDNPQSKGAFVDWYPNRIFGSSLIPGIPYSNSTIFGHAVYLMVHGGVHARAGSPALPPGTTIPSVNVPAISDPNRVKAILDRGLWLLAINNAKFNGPTFKSYTLQAASQLYGPSSSERNTVALAWAAVGIDFNCSSPPPTPSVTVQPWYCRGTHDISWTTVPGAAKYHGMAAPYPWAYESPHGLTTVDTSDTSCRQNVSSYTRFRLRACNACGCSAWSPDEWMEYWSPCQ